MTEFAIPAPELARLTHNALAFMPARSTVKVCRVSYDNEGLAIMATDLVTVGEDFWHGEGGDFDYSIDLSREDLQVLDKAARAAKKADVRIVIRDHDGMDFKSEVESISFLDASAERNPEDLWEMCDELLTLMQSAPVVPRPMEILYDPALLGRFAKVKPSGGKECIVHETYRNGFDKPLLKIGPTFRGSYMPVDREEAEASEDVGPEGLWGE